MIPRADSNYNSDSNNPIIRNIIPSFTKFENENENEHGCSIPLSSSAFTSTTASSSFSSSSSSSSFSPSPQSPTATAAAAADLTPLELTKAARTPIGLGFEMATTGSGDGNSTSSTNSTNSTRRSQRNQRNTDTVAVLRKQVAKLAGHAAKRRLDELYRTSRLPGAKIHHHQNHVATKNITITNTSCNPNFANTNPSSPVLLSWDDVFVEELLGMGSFASVCLVTCPKLRRHRQRIRRRTQETETDGYNTCNYNPQEDHENESHGCKCHHNENENENENENYQYQFQYHESSLSTMLHDDSGFSSSALGLSAHTTGSSTNPNPHSTTHHHYQQQQQQHLPMAFNPNKYFACKSLSHKTIQQANVRGFVGAAADLVHEGFLLRHIAPHPNLVRLYGIPGGEVERAFHCDDGDDCYETNNTSTTEPSNDNCNYNSDDSDDSGSTSSNTGGSDLGYFLIMEALTGGILGDKLANWREQRKRWKQRQRQRHDADFVMDDVSIPTLEERLEIALQIAMGMQHLHHHGIVFRDLKPQNVGLSVTTVPRRRSSASSSSSQPPPCIVSSSWRLFDFGLAREVERTGSTNDAFCYGKAGSLRYMAPETMGGKGRRSSSSGCYATFASDVYSFAIVLWELVGLEDFDKRYDSCPEDFESAVCQKGYRPSLRCLDKELADDLCNAHANANVHRNNPSLMARVLCRNRELRQLVEACWHEDYRQRPSFETILDKLREMLPPKLPDDSLHEPQAQAQVHHSPTQLQQNHQQHQHHQSPPTQLQQQQQQQQPSGRSRKSRRRFSGSKFNSVSMGLTNLTNHSVALSDLFENDMHLDETDDEYHESSDEESDDDFDDDCDDHRSFAMDDSSVAQAPSKQAPRVPFSVPVSITGRSHVPSTLSASAAIAARSHPPGPEFGSDREVPDYREQGTDRSG